MSGVENPSAFPNGLMGSLAESPGMSLRDYFAGQALTVVAGKGLTHGLNTVNVGSPLHPKLAAKAAYAYADAMLADRAGGAK